MEPGAVCWLTPAVPAEVEARLGADGRIETAKLALDRWELSGARIGQAPNPEPRSEALDLIAQFLVGFPRRRSLTRVRLGCTVGTLTAPGAVSHEVGADARERPALLTGVDEPQRAMLEVVAGRRWEAETIDLELRNWRSAEEWTLEITFARTGRFKFGRWSHEARVPWAEELWDPHPSDGDGPAVAVRRAVAASCVGEQPPQAAAQALQAAAKGIERDVPLQLFVSSTHTTVQRWASGELGAARALLRLATALDEGSGTAWPTTLRERIREHVPVEFVPTAWAAEALDPRATAAPSDLRAVIRSMLVRAIIAESDQQGQVTTGAAQQLLAELGVVRSENELAEGPRLEQALHHAERATTAYLAGDIYDELTYELNEALKLLSDPE
jgi:hypothetical protein